VRVSSPAPGNPMLATLRTLHWLVLVYSANVLGHIGLLRETDRLSF
jgi:hypothetical protein